jgi:hypothetical protein
MIKWRPILHLHNINVLYDGSEKLGGDARTTELEGLDISQTLISIQSDEWRDEPVLDFRKTDVNATILKQSLSPISYQNQETMDGPTKVCCNVFRSKSYFLMRWRKAISAEL